jgi:hypothetical protein
MRAEYGDAVEGRLLKGPAKLVECCEKTLQCTCTCEYLYKYKYEYSGFTVLVLYLYILAVYTVSVLKEGYPMYSGVLNQIHSYCSPQRPSTSTTAATCTVLIQYSCSTYTAHCVVGRARPSSGVAH